MMKKITLLFVLLFAGLSAMAQTTHNLNWYMGISTTDASLTIDAGDTVIWNFTDVPSHSVTSDAGSTETFDSGILSTGIGTTYSYTFATAGTNPYHCSVHPSMVGTITVNAVSTGPVNDDLANATALVMDAVCSGDAYTNVGATAQTGEPTGSCFSDGIGGTPDNSVWFSFVAPASGSVVITTDIAPGVLDDSEIAVYAAPTNLNDLSTLPAELGCNQDGNSAVVGNGWMSILDLTGLTSGNTYYIQVDGYIGDTGGFCIEVSEIACPDPSTLTAAAITATSADLGWTESGTAGAWDLYVVPAGDPAPTATSTPTDAGVTAVLYNKTGLTAGTAYDFYVRADCGGGDLSAWVGPFAFSTTCPANFTPNYSEDFTVFVPNCWEEADGGDATTGPTTPGFSDWTFEEFLNTGTNQSVNINIYSTGDQSWLISPQIDLTGGVYELTYMVAVTDFNNSNPEIMGSDDQVQVLITTDNGGTWAILNTHNQANSPSETGTLEIIDLSGYPNMVQLAFWATNGSVNDPVDYDFFIDDFVIHTKPACPQPNILTTANITDTTADLGWTYNGTATMWDIEIVTAGTTSTGTPTNAGVSNPFNATGLAPATNYEFYVRADCTGGDLSAWTGPFVFTTLCPTNFTPDYSEDFAVFVPNCWEVADGGDVTTGPTTPGSSDWTFEEFLNTGTNRSANINIYNTGDQSWLISPQIDLTGGAYELTYMVGVTDYASTNPETMGSDDQVQVLITTDNGVTWTILNTYNQANSPSETGTLETIDLSGYPSMAQLAFWATNGSVDDPVDYDFFIDDFAVTSAAPAVCFDPSAVIPSNITVNSVDLDWSENGTATAWDIEIGPQGFAPTGTPTHDNVAKPYTVTGLSALTIYDVYLRADCGSSTSAWVGPLTFSTGCGVFPIPFLQDFETSTTNLPSCWQSTSSTSRLWAFDDVASSSNTYFGDHTTGTGYFAFVDGSSTTTPDATLTTPPVDVSTLTTPMLEFYVHHFDNNSNQVLYDDNTITVEVFDGTAWQQVYMDNTADVNGWQLVQINVSTYVSAGPMLARFIVKTDLDTNFYNDIAIDDVSFKEAPSCFQPLSLTVANITGVSADLGWTDGGTAPTWDVYVVLAGDPAPTATTTPTDAGITNPYTKTGLIPVTDYQFYVRADCGAGDLSDWSGPFAFTTTCPTAYTPAYSEDFTTSMAPDCWAKAGSGTPATGPSGTSGSWAQDEFLNVSGSANQAAGINLAANSDEEWLISPAFDLSGGIYELVYKAALTDASNSNPPELLGMGSDDEVQVLITTDAGVTWTNLKTYNQAGFPSHTGSLEIIDLSIYTGTVSFAFWANEGSVDDLESSDFFIDDFKVRIPPACAQPTGLTVTNLTSNSADFTWTDNAGATTWNIEYGPIGFAQGTGTMLVDNDGIPSQSVSGLDFATDYEFYVQADCGIDQSPWTGPSPFSTPCPIAIIPDYLEDFTTDVAPTCWAEAGSGTPATGPSGTSGSWLQDEFLNISGSANQAARNNFASASDEEWLISPSIDLSVGGYELVYTAAVTDSGNSNPPEGTGMGSDDELQVLISPDNGVTWTNLKTYNATNYPSSTGVLETIDLSAYTSTVKFAFWANEGSVDDPESYDFFIDDFMVRTMPSCSQPNLLTATNILATSADLGWTENNVPPVSLWDVYVVPAGDPAPTGTTTPTDAGITTPTYNKTGLTAQTAYEFYVRADCGGGDSSSWTGPFAFTTPCAGVIPQYVEDFTTFVPNCWAESGSGDSTTGPDATSSTSDWLQDEYLNIVGSTDQAARMNIFSNTDQEWLISTPIDLSAGGYELLYNVAVTDYNNSDPSAMGSDDQVQVLLSTDNGATWSNLLVTYDTSNTPSNTGQLEIIDLAAYTSATTKIAFWATDGATNDLEDYDFFIDNFEIRTKPTCAQPTALTVANITAAGADLDWIQAGTATLWDVEIVPAGTVPTTTPTATGITKPYTATGLISNTAYEFYVRADCGGGDLSAWTGPFAFNTALTCGNMFVDDGGTAGDYLNDANKTWVVYPSVPGDVVTVTFTSFNTEATWDALYVYDGPDTTYPLINSGLTMDPASSFPGGGYYGTAIPGPFTSTDPSGVLTFVFLSDSNTTEIGWEAIVTCSTSPSCAIPITLAATNILATSADLGWFETGTATMWDIEVVTAGTTPTGTPTDAGAMTNPYNKTGLTGTTAYEFYVRADCGTGSLSVWAGPFAFTTLAPCSPPTAVIATPIDDVSADIMWIAGGSETEWEVEYGATGFTLGTGTVVADTDGTVGITLTGLTAATSYEVYVTSICGPGYESAPLGPVGLTTLAPCSPPTAVIATSIDDVSADIMWIAGGSETEWEVEYGLTGFTLGTGTVVADTDGTVGITLTGLTAVTSYEVYVTAICGPGFESAPVSPVGFTTLAPCPPPSNPVVANIAQTTVDLSWTAPTGGPFESEWAVFAPGANPLNDNPLISGDVTIGVTAVQITGLTPDTTYDLYVRTVCDESTDYYSDPPTGPITFTTLELGISSEVLETFTYYPNPTASELFLKAGSKIQEVIVYDLLGREILKIQPNSLESILELSNVQDGAYLMKVSVNGAEAIYRLMKKE